ncbi:MAG TPA: hypothetical protein VGK24_01260 [Candidatus Angelobacter sp.]|jgi:hypothetical protein
MKDLNPHPLRASVLRRPAQQKKKTPGEAPGVEVLFIAYRLPALVAQHGPPCSLREGPVGLGVKELWTAGALACAPLIYHGFDSINSWPQRSSPAQRDDCQRQTFNSLSH